MFAEQAFPPSAIQLQLRQYASVVGQIVVRRLITCTLLHNTRGLPVAARHSNRHKKALQAQKDISDAIQPPAVPANHTAPPSCLQRQDCIGGSAHEQRQISAQTTGRGA